jgi:hypothetical protein
VDLLGLICAGRFNTTYFTGEAFNFNDTWLNNPDAVLMGVVTSGGTNETNGTVGTVVLKLSNPVYAPPLYFPPLPACA